MKFVDFIATIAIIIISAGPQKGVGWRRVHLLFFRIMRINWCYNVNNGKQ